MSKRPQPHPHPHPQKTSKRLRISNNSGPSSWYFVIDAMLMGDLIPDFRDLLILKRVNKETNTRVEEFIQSTTYYKRMVIFNVKSLLDPICGYCYFYDKSHSNIPIEYYMTYFRLITDYVANTSNDQNPTPDNVEDTSIRVPDNIINGLRHIFYNLNRQNNTVIVGNAITPVKVVHTSLNYISRSLWYVDYKLKLLNCLFLETRLIHCFVYIQNFMAKSFTLVWCNVINLVLSTSRLCMIQCNTSNVQNIKLVSPPKNMFNETPKHRIENSSNFNLILINNGDECVEVTIESSNTFDVKITGPGPVYLILSNTYNCNVYLCNGTNSIIFSYQSRIKIHNVDIERGRGSLSQPKITLGLCISRADIKLQAPLRRLLLFSSHPGLNFNNVIYHTPNALPVERRFITPDNDCMIDNHNIPSIEFMKEQ